MQVVQCGHLGLHRTRDVLVLEVALGVRRLDRVAFVWMKDTVDDLADAEIASDLTVVVDAQQLVEGHVFIVVDLFEPIIDRLGVRNADGRDWRCRRECRSA